MKTISMAIIAASFMMNGIAFAGILKPDVDPEAAKSAIEQVDQRLTEARDYIMNKTNFRNGFGDVGSALQVVLDVIDPDSELAKKLADNKSEIDNTLIEIPEEESQAALARENFERIAQNIEEAKNAIVAEVP